MNAGPADQLQELYRRGEARWQQFRDRRGEAFHAFVPADYEPLADVLGRLRPHADSFLELGSGVGVVTIAAGLLGYDASGIEIDPWLVEAAQDLAAEFDAPVTFASGTFVPGPFQDAVDRQEAELPTVADGVPAYDELGRDLDDFDLIYAFPWPGLEELFFALIREHGRPGALFLTFGGTEGYRVFRDGDEIAL